MNLKSYFKNNQYGNDESENGAKFFTFEYDQKWDKSIQSNKTSIFILKPLMWFNGPLIFSHVE